MYKIKINQFSIIRIINLKIGTWNVLTLFKTEAAQCVVSEIHGYKLRVVALQEIKWSEPENSRHNNPLWEV